MWNYWMWSLRWGNLPCLSWEVDMGSGSSVSRSRSSQKCQPWWRSRWRGGKATLLSLWFSPAVLPAWKQYPLCPKSVILLRSAAARVYPDRNLHSFVSSGEWLNQCGPCFGDTLFWSPEFDSWTFRLSSFSQDSRTPWTIAEGHSIHERSAKLLFC